MSQSSFIMSYLPFQVSVVQVSWFKPQTFECWVWILWYLISLAYNNYFINILIFTFFYLATCCVGCIFLTEMNYIWITYILTYKVFKNGPSKICGRQPLKILKEYGLLKADHKFYLVRSWILCSICCNGNNYSHNH